MRTSRPKIMMTIQNYHYETRTTGTGRNRRTTRVRVNTHKASSEFRYVEWSDDSSSEYALQSVVDKIKLTRLEVRKNFDFSP